VVPGEVLYVDEHAVAVGGMRTSPAHVPPWDVDWLAAGGDGVSAVPQLSAEKSRRRTRPLLPGALTASSRDLGSILAGVEDEVRMFGWLTELQVLVIGRRFVVVPSRDVAKVRPVDVITKLADHRRERTAAWVEAAADVERYPPRRFDREDGGVNPENVVGIPP
jgi:hypothetical protein